MSMKVKLMRKFLKRPYGIVYFKLKNTLYPKVMNFSKDSVTVNNGFYVLEKGSIIIEVEGVKKEFKLAEYQSWKEGYPIMFFDVNDCIPLKFQNDVTEGETHRPHPQAIQAIIKKELQAAEAEIMRKQRSTLFKIMVVVMLVCILGFVFSLYTWMDVGKIVKHFGIQ